MSISTRDSVTPLHDALVKAGYEATDTIFLKASFDGLPLVAPALEKLFPVGDSSFLVTVRNLIQVIGSLNVDDIINALAEIAKETSVAKPSPPSPSPPVTTPKPPPVIPTCTVTPDPFEPEDDYHTAMTIAGYGFLESEVVAIIDDINSAVLSFINAETSIGSYSATISFLHVEGTPLAQKVHAQGLTSKRMSTTVSFTT